VGVAAVVCKEEARGSGLSGNKKAKKLKAVVFCGFENIYRTGDKFLRDRYLADACEGDTLLHIASRQSIGMKARGKGNTPNELWDQRQELVQLLMSAGIDPSGINCGEPPLSARQVAPTLWLFEHLQPSSGEGQGERAKIGLTDERRKAMEIARKTFNNPQVKKKLWRQLDGNGNGTPHTHTPYYAPYTHTPLTPCTHTPLTPYTHTPLTPYTHTPLTPYSYTR
jgi:hypothetical protein